MGLFELPGGTFYLLIVFPYIDLGFINPGLVWYWYWVKLINDLCILLYIMAITDKQWFNFHQTLMEHVLQIAIMLSSTKTIKIILPGDNMFSSVVYTPFIPNHIQYLGMKSKTTALCISSGLSTCLCCLADCNRLKRTQHHLPQWGEWM